MRQSILLICLLATLTYSQQRCDKTKCASGCCQDASTCGTQDFCSDSTKWADQAYARCEFGCLVDGKCGTSKEACQKSAKDVTKCSDYTYENDCLMDYISNPDRDNKCAWCQSKTGKPQCYDITDSSATCYGSKKCFQFTGAPIQMTCDNEPFQVDLNSTYSELFGWGIYSSTFLKMSDTAICLAKGGFIQTRDDKQTCYWCPDSMRAVYSSFFSTYNCQSFSDDKTSFMEEQCLTKYPYRTMDDYSQQTCDYGWKLQKPGVEIGGVCFFAINKTLASGYWNADADTWKGPKTGATDYAVNTTGLFFDSQKPCDTWRVNKCTVSNVGNFADGPDTKCAQMNVTGDSYTSQKNGEVYVENVTCDQQLCDLSQWNGGKSCYDNQSECSSVQGCCSTQYSCYTGDKGYCSLCTLDVAKQCNKDSNGAKKCCVTANFIPGKGQCVAQDNTTSFQLCSNEVPTPDPSWQDKIKDFINSIPIMYIYIGAASLGGILVLTTIICCISGGKRKQSRNTGNGYQVHKTQMATSELSDFKY